MSVIKKKKGSPGGITVSKADFIRAVFHLTEPGGIPSLELSAALLN
jgi:hypothetical protein